MVFQKLVVGAAMALSLACAGAAQAAYVLVGSWQVDEGPAWDSAGPDGPLAYTAQEAAALLFGGDPADYAISIVSDPSEVNFVAWYAQLGTDDVGLFDQDFSAKYLGQFYGPVASHDDKSAGVASAYVNDRVRGDRFKNYAFRYESAAPEPATWALLISGFGLAGTALRRRRSRAAASVHEAVG